ncbi:hypothetical protein R5W23_004889 [Gemmata sp. JC673]|uniref:7-cyano-7-deazaguanine synthase n=1 Tax=Gemmata algarum TaxID=2975278 RepID=A0ABU5F7S7_9BACT|nr:hypothetical protein [Gemmata algarum]MDY3563386.1 hypothetical protein [Gemmata algarum]
MDELNLVLCGGLSRAAAPRTRQRVRQIPLEFGSAADVHLRVNQLTDAMCAKADSVTLDLLELAAYVHTADQAVTRGGAAEIDYGDGWRRRFRFEVPVRLPALWRRPDVQRALTGALEFLTDDVYEFGFHQAVDPRRSSDYLVEGGAGGVDEVVLFSGGLDSLCGAVTELERGRRVVLLSHRSSTRIFARQRALFDALRARVPAGPPPLHVHVTLNKDEGHGREFTQRGRSFVFAALAAATARLAGLDRFRFYENGVTSLNLPLSPELVGARASRTTHPQVLARFGRLFTLLFGSPFAVENAAQGHTKVELLERLRASGHAPLCALTCSCSRVWGQPEARPHCGRCSQCVDRRLCALAAGLSDADDPPDGYASDPLTGAREGPDLTLAERYVGLARELAPLEGPRAFAVRFPEVNAALAYLGTSPAAAAAACHDLYRRHADGVARGVRRALDAVGVLNLHAVPPPSLLGLVLGRGVPGAAPPAPFAPSERGFVVDPDRFQVRFNGAPCQLGNTKEFHFIARLHRGRGVYLSLAVLGRDVWDDAGVAKGSVHRVAASARRSLVALGLPPETIDGSNKGHYRLTLPAT